jgi:hypothetical protein
LYRYWDFFTKIATLNIEKDRNEYEYEQDRCKYLTLVTGEMFVVVEKK